MILAADLRGRLERLSLNSSHRIRGSRVGRHRSLNLGESLDFSDYRPYTIGDDYRRIDHNLRARLGVTLVRLFDAEEELPVRLVIDTSGSMGFYGKLTAARLAAAMVCYVALSRGDRVLPLSVPGTRDRPFDTGPRGRHVAAWPAVERWLEALSPEHTARVEAAVRHIAADAAIRGQTVFVTDLLNEGWQGTLDTLGVSGGGLVVHVMAPEEIEPDLSGDVILVDSETGSVIKATASARYLDDQRVIMEAFVDEAAARARRAGLDYVLVVAGRDVAGTMLSTIARTGGGR